MARYKVTMTAVSDFGKRTLEQCVVCDSERDTIKLYEYHMKTLELYGLHDPDLINYKIEKLED